MLSEHFKLFVVNSLPLFEFRYTIIFIIHVFSDLEIVYHARMQRYGESNEIRCV